MTVFAQESFSVFFLNRLHNKDDVFLTENVSLKLINEHDIFFTCGSMFIASLCRLG